MRDDIASILVAVALVGFVAAFLIWRRLTSPSRIVHQCLQQIKAGEKPDFPVRTDFDFDLVQIDGGFQIRPLKGLAYNSISVLWERITEANA